jgi:hypothetical protein
MFVQHSVVKGLPKLLSLSIDGCFENDGDIKYVDFKLTITPPPPLVHLSSRFYRSAGLSKLWEQYLNLRVIELEGRRAKDFWRRHAVCNSEEYRFEGSSRVIIYYYLNLLLTNV